MSERHLPTPGVEVLRFGRFELRLDSLELLRDGQRVPLQQQPARLLALLASRPGVTVTREEIGEALWGEGTFVDSRQGTNYCIRQIRIALDDRPDRPHLVETVARRGYRFIAPVRRVEAGGATGPADAIEESGEAAATRSGAPGRAWGPTRARARGRRRLGRVALAALAVVAAATVAALLAGRGDPGTDPAPAVRTTVIPEQAHFHYLEARHLLDRADSLDPVADARRATELLRAALAEAPDYAPAHSALGSAWLYRYDVPRAESLGHAEEAARRALELAPDLASAHALLAAPLLFLHFDWDGAGEHVQRALELDPNTVDALFLRAIMLSARGRHDEGIATARRAVELEPGHLPNVSLGWFYFFARRYDQAIEEAERILELAPTDEPSHRVLVLAALESGDEARAERELWRWALEKTFESAKAYGRDLPPDRELREQIEREMEAEAEEHPERYPGGRELLRIRWEKLDERRDLIGRAMNPTTPAEYAVYAGDTDAAIRSLLWGCEEQAGSWDLPFVAEDPRWDPLRGEPGFEKVVECVGVEEDPGWIPSLRWPFE